MIRIKQGPEPFSPASLSLDRNAEPILIESNVERLLRQELTRYCNGEVDGRSFLIAGHRGAGKTTTVLNAVLHVWRLKESNKLKLRPLPVVLHGPALFPPAHETKPAVPPPKPAEPPPSANKPTPPPNEEAQELPAAGAVLKGGGSTTTAAANAAAGVATAAAGQATQAATQAAQAAAQASQAATSAEPPMSEAENALVQIILGLHRAVAREFLRGYWRRTMNPQITAALRGAHWGVQAAELAAQFEAELSEGPAPARLREFWDLVDATASGVLFDTLPLDPAVDRAQGARELVALDGIVRAYRRLTGKFSQTDTEKTNATSERTSKTDVNLTDAIKPFVSVATGAALAGGVAVATAGSLFKALIAGIVGAVGAAAVFKFSSSRSHKVEYSREEKWIPNREANTLDRVLPTIIDRLRAAGLAPVFIVDELDKVQGLSARLQSMVHHLKKLVAENALFCFLADRGYFEDLEIRSERVTYGVDYSYYSFRRLVCFRPQDMDHYLSRSLEAVATGSPVQLAEKELDSDKLDLPVLRLVLRHRAEMHALSLKRELAAVRGDNDEVQIPPGDVRTRRMFRVDLSFQVAIESALALESVSEWLAQHPEKVQTLYDALYYLSRKWKAEQYEFDLSEKERKAFAEELEQRMNLDEARGAKAPRVPAAKANRRKSALSDQEVDFLFSKVQWLANALSVEAKKSDDPIQMLKEHIDSPREGAATNDQAVNDALLHGNDSLLILVDETLRRYEFRYYRSGEKREADQKTRAAKVAGAAAPLLAIEQADLDRIAHIINFEQWLWLVWRTKTDPQRPSGRLFSALAEQYRVLPTTPAWPTVQRAIERLLKLQVGTPVDPVIADDLQCINEFWAVLRGSSQTIVRVLISAAFFGRARLPGESSALVRLGLGTLARGLRFAERDIDSVRKVLDALIERFGSDERFGSLKSIVNSIDSDVGASPVSKALEKSLTSPIDAAVALAAGALGEESGWSKIRQDAWVECGHRLLAFVKNGTETEMEPNEFLCFAHGSGPALLIAASLRQMNLNRWTTALVHAIKARSTTGGPVAEEHVPRWLAVFALAQLGYRGLDPSAAEAQFSKLLGGGTVADPSEVERLHELIVDEGLLGGHLGDLGTLLFIRRSQSTLSEEWRQCDARLFTLTPTILQAKEVLAAISLLVPELPRPATIAWEQESDSLREEAELAKRVKALENPQLPFKQGWAYRSMPPQPPKAPFVISPRSPSEVVEALWRSPAS